MKALAVSILAITLFTAPSFGANFEGSFGRAHLSACNAVDGNWVGAFDSCPPLGNGFGAPEEAAAPAPVAPPPKECPYKDKDIPA